MEKESLETRGNHDFRGPNWPDDWVCIKCGNDWQDMTPLELNHCRGYKLDSKDPLLYGDGPGDYKDELARQQRISGE